MMDIMSIARPLVLEGLLVALGAATVCAVVLWRMGRYRQRKLKTLGKVIEELRTENQQLARTAGSVSHELVQPLGTITNYAAIIRMQSTGDVRGYASSILEVSAEAARRIRERFPTLGGDGQPSEPSAKFMSDRVEVVEPPRANETASLDSWASSSPVTASSERLP